MREADLETEAIALSRLGTLFRRALGDKARATQYYLASFRLAESAWPRSFKSELWFREARQVGAGAACGAGTVWECTGAVAHWPFHQNDCTRLGQWLAALNQTIHLDKGNVFAFMCAN